jgi:hypothetical protein
MRLAIQREADAKLEALWTLVARVQDLELDRADRSSSLPASLSTAAELLDGWVDTAAANKVRWGLDQHWLPPCRAS